MRVFSQGGEACLCKSEAVVESQLCADVISKVGIRVVTDAKTHIGALGAHAFHPYIALWPVANS